MPSRRTHEAMHQHTEEDRAGGSRREVELARLIVLDAMPQRAQRLSAMPGVQLVAVRVRLPHVIAQRGDVRIAGLGSFND